MGKALSAGSQRIYDISERASNYGSASDPYLRSHPRRLLREGQRKYHCQLERLANK